MPEPSKLDLKKTLQEERKEKLSPVTPDFNEPAKKIRQELEVELSRADPGSTKYPMVEGELTAAKKNYNAIIEIRMAKINYEASVRKSLKRQENNDPENMTPDEQELYTGLYSTMRNWRSARMNLSAQVKEKEKEKEQAPAILPQPAPEPVKKHEEKRDIKDYVVVRMLRDIPAFAGMDGRNYMLAKEDIATVPAVNAKALIARGVAVQVPGLRSGK